MLKARHIVRQELTDERRQAAALFREAIGRDPEFALAYAGLADMLVGLARWRLAGWEIEAQEAQAAAERAVNSLPGWPTPTSRWAERFA